MNGAVFDFDSGHDPHQHQDAKAKGRKRSDPRDDQSQKHPEASQDFKNSGECPVVGHLKALKLGAHQRGSQALVAVDEKPKA